MVARLTRTLFPLGQRRGVAALAQLEMDTLAGQLRKEMLVRNAASVSPAAIQAWARKNQTDNKQLYQGEIT